MSDSKIADLNEETLWDLKNMQFGDNLELLTIVSLEMRTNYDAHTHVVINTVATNSLSAINPISGLEDATERARVRTRLTGLGVDGAFIDVWEKTIALVATTQAAYNGHEHTVEGGVPSTTAVLTDLPVIPTKTQIEIWNRAYEPFFNAKVGTLLFDTRNAVIGLAAFMSAHTHSDSMTDTTNLPLSILTFDNTLN